MPNLNSWGRHPGPPQHSLPVYWEAEINTTIKHLQDQAQLTLPFGNGRSYGDSCLASSNQVTHLRHLNKFVSADWVNGEITVEAGVTLEEILQLSIPRGWFLPVTPGTQYVTVGGAISNDVHGKNHHVKGTFGRHLQDIKLFRSDKGILTASPTENQEYFKACIGGLGLTGIITHATLKLQPINSSQIDVTTERFDNLSEFMSLSDELDQTHEYSVAWIDCLAKGNTVGRGVFSAGNHSNIGNLEVPEAKFLSIPVTPPISLINSYSVKVFNTLYFNKAYPERKHSVQHYAPFFYPLDGISHWNRLYGKRGFQQYQCVIPTHNAKETITEMLKRIAHHGHGSFLAVLKRCGNLTSPGLLSFPLEGVSLALDFANNSRSKPLLSELDSIVGESGGRLYPAKDAHMSAQLFQQGYPQWEEIEKLRDPILLSKFWERVTK